MRNTDAGGTRVAASAFAKCAPIPGTSSIQHLRDNLQATAPSLPADTLARLDAIAADFEVESH
jgi:aryl-alcohol dehydrogenase-like predicted oxidoreductase